MRVGVGGVQGVKRFDAADVPYLVAVVGAMLVVWGVARLSMTAALIASGFLLLVWADRRVGGRKAGPG